MEIEELETAIDDVFTGLCDQSFEKSQTMTRLVAKAKEFNHHLATSNQKVAKAIPVLENAARQLESLSTFLKNSGKK